MDIYEQLYKEALERAKEIYNSSESGWTTTRTCERIFPELKESEDERIRESIHIYLDWLDGRKDYQPKGEYTIRDMIAWLKKQGEKKPAVWSEEDEKKLKRAIHLCSDNLELFDHTGLNDDIDEGVISWLKSLKPQKQ